MIRLRRGGPHRADADVIDCSGDALCLRGILDGQSEELAWPERGAGCTWIAVALTEMKTIGVAGQRDVEPVVDDEPHTSRAQFPHKPPRQIHHRPVVERLVAQLDRPRTTRRRGACLLDNRQGGIGVGHNIDGTDHATLIRAPASSTSGVCA